MLSNLLFRQPEQLGFGDQGPWKQHSGHDPVNTV